MCGLRETSRSARSTDCHAFRTWPEYRVASSLLCGDNRGSWLLFLASKDSWTVRKGVGVRRRGMVDVAEQGKKASWLIAKLRTDSPNDDSTVLNVSPCGGPHKIVMGLLLNFSQKFYFCNRGVSIRRRTRILLALIPTFTILNPFAADQVEALHFAVLAWPTIFNFWHSGAPECRNVKN